MSFDGKLSLGISMQHLHELQGLASPLTLCTCVKSSVLCIGKIKYTICIYWLATKGTLNNKKTLICIC